MVQHYIQFEIFTINVTLAMNFSNHFLSTQTTTPPGLPTLRSSDQYTSQSNRIICTYYIVCVYTYYTGWWFQPL